MSNISEIKAMSFNLRLDGDYDGENTFFKRTDLVLDAIRRADPDIIGFQEVRPRMRKWIRENLKNYTIQGCGRGRVFDDESTTIAYRTDKFELVSLENIWLSNTPDVPGSTYGGDQSPCPRMFTSALLCHLESGKWFRFVNTHLDHVGNNARVLGAAQIMQHIELKKYNFILTGDFNAEPGSPEIELITSTEINGRRVTDCTAGIGGTFHDFGRLPEEKRSKIDYIFTDMTCVASSVVEDPHENGRYYSDHNAVTAVIALQ